MCPAALPVRCESCDEMSAALRRWRRQDEVAQTRRWWIMASVPYSAWTDRREPWPVCPRYRVVPTSLSDRKRETDRPHARLAFLYTRGQGHPRGCQYRCWKKRCVEKHHVWALLLWSMTSPLAESSAPPCVVDCQKVAEDPTEVTVELRIKVTLVPVH